MTQSEALTILKTGANVFLTGEPGSGKTHTINCYVAYLRSCGIEPAITASTGIAATHIGGLTIHSWSGIGIRQKLSKYDIDKIGQNKNVVRRVAGANILIIDEVSMISAQTLAMVDSVCREVRRSKESFGGLQVILVGDFFQLPPVSQKNKQETLMQEQFAYQSSTWNTLNPIICYLSEQHRQEDPAFLEFLSSVRRGDVEERHKVLLRTRYTPEAKDKITQLYSHNADVDVINQRKLVALSGKEKTFEMQGRGPEKLVTSLKRGCLSPEELTLKVGAPVMFTKNDTGKQYVNGTLGVVSSFSKNNGYPIIKTHIGKSILAEPDEWRIEDSGRVLARVMQVPLRLAWAVTVHKSQGMSLDAAHLDLSRAFEYGQGYVALSRIRSLNGLFLAGLNKRALEVHPEVYSEDFSFRANSEEARKKFSGLDKKEIENMHQNFIKTCGGKSNSGRVKRNVSTYEKTCALLKEGKTFAEIAKDRGLTVGTIIDHTEKLAEEKKIDPNKDLTHINRPKKFIEMKKVLEEVYKREGKMLLSEARSILGESCDYEELRLVRLFLYCKCPQV